MMKKGILCDDVKIWDEKMRFSIWKIVQESSTRYRENSIISSFMWIIQIISHVMKISQ